mgnify:FL=1
MQFLHWEVNLDADASVCVRLDRQANVLLLDESNFQAYRAGRSHRYHGGLAKKSPVLLSAPHAGRWHVVVNLGGYAGRVNASVAVEANSPFRSPVSTSIL